MQRYSDTAIHRTLVPLYGCIAVSLMLLLPAPSLAQSQVDPAHKMAWCENGGWTNWADGGSGAGPHGGPFSATALRGVVWGENVGWINVGNGPADGVHYANVSSSDYGVNADGSGNLTG